MRVIHWFRSDLRIEDNTALAAAGAPGSELVPVFVLDEVLLAQHRDAHPRLRFLDRCLRDLARALDAAGSRLVVVRGAPERRLPELARACGASLVTWNRDYGPYAKRRDRAVHRALERDGVEVRDVQGPGRLRRRRDTHREGCAVLRLHALSASVVAPVPRRPAREGAGSRHAPAVPESRLERQRPGRLPRMLRRENRAALRTEATRTADRSPGRAAAPTSLSPPPFGRIRRRSLSAEPPRRAPGSTRSSTPPPAAITSIATSPPSRAPPASRPTFGLARFRCVSASARDSRSPGIRAGRGRWGPRSGSTSSCGASSSTPSSMPTPGCSTARSSPDFAALEWDTAPRPARSVEGRHDGVSDRGRGDAGARRDRLDAQPRAHDRRELPRQGPAPRLARRGTLVHASARGRRPREATTAGGNGRPPRGRTRNRSSGYSTRLSQGERFDPDGAYVRRWVPELAGLPGISAHRPWDAPAASRGGYPSPIVDHRQ